MTEDFDADELAMLRQLFRSEAHDALEAVTARVLAGGSSRPSADALAEMMRVTHTLKGAAGTVGLPGMVDLAHRLEDALVAIAGLARAAVAWPPGAADLLVEVIDRLRAYLDHVDEPDADARASALHAQIDQLARPHRRPASQPPALDASPEPELVERVAIGPGAGDPGGGDPGVPAPAALEPARAPTASAAPDAPVPEPRSWLRVEPARIDELMSSAGELLFDRTRIERRVELLRTLARDLARTRQTLRDALDDDAQGRAPLRGPVVEAEAELAGHAALLGQTTVALLGEIEALRRTIGELQHGLNRVRMAPARSLMTRAARTLRALRRATGVDVELRTVGEDTELDKAVSEYLVDPVTQLLRNAVAHGIEPAAERVAQGKPAVATVTIRARQESNTLVLEVADDGRGIDTAAVAERLVATGRWSASRARLATESDVLDALLDTGVSTRSEADELAGRGVGISLVRQTVAKLGGEVTVASQPGKGTTFTLRLPLSAALAQALLFKVDGQVYAIPSVHVAETTLVEGYAISHPVRHDVVPVLRLEQLLGHGAPGDRRPAVVVSFGGKTLVCTVDKIIGTREIIIKPLGPLLAPLTLYAGATISGSGKVQLILDPAQLVRRSYPDTSDAIDSADDPRMSPGALAGRALVVDDSSAIREAMTSMLGDEGWIVDVAEDGARALQLTRQLRYDLVVTDLEMPGLGGFDLIMRLRKDFRFTATPIVIITSRASPEHRRRARELGVRALVAKPITRRKLLEALAAR
jgi:chemosensory pili system protein ChpA (sensor histidine kinase/response regulator)